MTNVLIQLAESSADLKQKEDYLRDVQSACSSSKEMLIDKILRRKPKECPLDPDSAALAHTRASWEHLHLLRRCFRSGYSVREIASASGLSRSESKYRNKNRRGIRQLLYFQIMALEAKIKAKEEKRKMEKQ